MPLDTILILVALFTILMNLKLFFMQMIFYCLFLNGSLPLLIKVINMFGGMQGSTPSRISMQRMQLALTETGFVFLILVYIFRQIC